VLLAKQSSEMRLLSIATAVAFAASFASAALVDVCANIDADLKVDVLGIAVVVGILDVCLCLSAVPLFISSNLVAAAAVDLVGVSAVEAELNSLINSSHHVPACPSGTPKKKRDAKYIAKRALCATHETACGVYGGSARSFDCVDTRSDLESCGGCAVPLLPTQTVGRDCSAIQGVSDVSCVYSKCVVHSCRPGFHPSKGLESCIEEVQEGTKSVFVEAAEEVLENLWWKV